MDMLLPKPEQILPNKMNSIHSTAFNSRYLFWQDIKGERLNMSFNSETRIRVTSRQRYQIYAVCWLTLNSNGPFVINFICIVDCWAKIGNTSFRVYWRNFVRVIYWESCNNLAASSDYTLHVYMSTLWFY